MSCDGHMTTCLRCAGSCSVIVWEDGEENGQQEEPFHQRRFRQIEGAWTEDCEDCHATGYVPCADDECELCETPNVEIRSIG